MSTARLRHVGALDGLRGLAVLAVLVYHLDERWLPGGFLGVSLFFTLSGFLITNLLLNEWEASHRVGLGSFWSRRFRRLLPAALAGLALAVVTAWWWADAQQLENLRGDVLAALTYVANWRFVVNGDAYGAGFQEPSPVLHYWSLAIEEQFYIFVAVVALVVARYARHRRAWLATFGTLALLSMLATVRLWGTADTDRIYFGSDTRAFELLAGVLLAIVIRFHVPGRVARWSGRHIVWIAAAVGMVAAVALADVGQAWLYHGGFWLVALGSVLLIVASLDTGPVSRGLGWRPLVALGLISYGVYLYHWPIVVFVTSDRTGLDGVPLAAVQVALTLGLAIASYHLLEQPVRERRWTIRPAALVAAAGVTGLVLLLATTALDRASTTRDVVATPDLALATTGAPSAPPDEPPGPAVDQAGVPLERVLLLGDSLVHQSARTLASRLHDAGIETRIIGGDGQHLLWNDEAWKAQLDAAMEAFDPQVVVLEACCGWGSPWRTETVTAPDGTVLQPDTDASWREWARMAALLTDDARAQGRAVVWVLAPPAQTNGYYGPVEGRIGVANGIYRTLAACRTDVGLLDWSILAGPDGRFVWSLPDASGREVQVRHPDGLHFTPEGQAVLADATVASVEASWRRLGTAPAPTAGAPATAPTCGP